MKNKKRFLLIVNPVSGRGTLRPKLWQILNIFSEASIATTVMFTQKRGDATEFAKSCPKDFDAVVCAGGDGTLNRFANDTKNIEIPCEISYLALGTGNDFLKDIEAK